MLVSCLTLADGNGSADFKKAFSIPVKIHFMGCWLVESLLSHLSVKLIVLFVHQGQRSQCRRPGP